MKKTITLLDDFCTPPISVETEYDRKVIANAQIKKIDFEDQILHCYLWGEGKTVLLVHGWGSKASHLALLARHLARTGFRAIAIDGPSHGHSLKNRKRQQSSMFEFGRALHTVTSELGPIYALVGHSLGALASIFTSSGHGKLALYQVRPKRLVLISSPISIEHMIEVYCRREGLSTEQKRVLTNELEQSFDFSIADYSVLHAFRRVRSKLLIVHDVEDVEVPFPDAVSLHRNQAGSQLVTTKGGGHHRILADRVMFRAVQAFLLDSETK